MPNVHGLFSNRDEEENDNTNSRYVGGVSSQGGGSGLAVEPDTNDASNLMSSIRNNAEDGSAAGENERPARTITLYRSGFTVDNGPLRRLDDPNNSEFLRDLAKGIVPRELQEGGSGEGKTVGLVDKRHMEYEDDNAAAASDQRTPSFHGEGQSLGSTSTAPEGGIIDPATAASMESAVDESNPTTVIQVRLLNGKRLKVKINVSASIMQLVHHIQASGDAGEESYVLSAGFPPKILDDLNKSIEESGLKGSQIIQKKA